VAASHLVALGRVPKADFAYLQKWGEKVQKASHDAPGQWRTWWWVCFAGQIVFLPFIWMLVGRWSPRRAREDARIHSLATQREQRLAEESAGSGTSSVSPPGVLEPVPEG
jgi:hypothetical protein